MQECNSLLLYLQVTSLLLLLQLYDCEYTASPRSVPKPTAGGVKLEKIPIFNKNGIIMQVLCILLLSVNS